MACLIECNCTNAFCIIVIIIIIVNGCLVHDAILNTLAVAAVLMCLKLHHAL